MTGKRQIEARWGVEFWQLVSDFAEQGLNRSDKARALGYRVDSFSKLLAQNPRRDPFDAFIVAQAYLKDTGETMRRALERMAAEGRSWAYAARAIGYGDAHNLKRAAIERGIIVEMNSRPGRPQTRQAAQKRDSLTTNWPSWEKVYEITGGVKPTQRKKRANGSK